MYFHIEVECWADLLPYIVIYITDLPIMAIENTLLGMRQIIQKKNKNEEKKEKKIKMKKIKKRKIKRNFIRQILKRFFRDFRDFGIRPKSKNR